MLSPLEMLARQMTLNKNEKTHNFILNGVAIVRAELKYYYHYHFIHFNFRVPEIACTW